jgi:hypothetical protein
VITNTEIVCVDEIDGVETVVMSHARARRRAPAFLSYDG